MTVERLLRLQWSIAIEVALWIYVLAAAALSLTALFIVDWYCSPKNAGKIRRQREALQDRARGQEDESGKPPA